MTASAAALPMLLQLLGAPRLPRDGQVLRVGSRKALALLAVTALDEGATRERLAGLLWMPTNASPRLRACVSLQARPCQAAISGIEAIRCFHSAGPVSCTETPVESTATVTGMSLTSNS